MKILKLLFTLVIASFLLPLSPAFAFCGFYVSKADTSLYNQASQVVIARQGNRTVLTMANDYQGDVKDFALVVPVPVVLEAEQVHVGDPTIIERLDDFSAPRLVEYFDENPCQTYRYDEGMLESAAPVPSAGRTNRAVAEYSLGVTVESRFNVGEYEILILSATESEGLETWLTQNGYKLPQGAAELLRPYIRQNLKFFVAKVDLEEFETSGYEFLRPLMMAYESPRFMLPIRLGMTNAKGEQDLVVYLLSSEGQTELTNYRTVQVPSNLNIPEFVQAEFADFYTAMFANAHQRENKRVAFVEYAWDMGSCDPCSAQPLNLEELRKAGVFWLTPGSRQNVFITRLHVRYSRDTFPEDLRFQTTGNRQFFQGRYVVRHPYRGEMSCNAADDYLEAVKNRQEEEAQTLAQLTGWNIQEIRDKIKFVETPDKPWWRNLWFF